MPSLTMTPCYSIMLCMLAVALLVVITAPLLMIILKKAWGMVDALYVKITRNKPQ